MTKANLRISFGMPWISSRGEETALWPNDEITILARAGSHRFCRVVYGNWEYPKMMYGWIHKRWLKEFPQ